MCVCVDGTANMCCPICEWFAYHSPQTNLLVFCVNTKGIVRAMSTGTTRLGWTICIPYSLCVPALRNNVDGSDAMYSVVGNYLKNFFFYCSNEECNTFVFYMSLLLFLDLGQFGSKLLNSHCTRAVQKVTRKTFYT